jgi:hypothetical protein
MKRRILVATVLLLISTVSAAVDDPYGLLFTSPGQRAQLDNRFASAASEDQAPAGAVAGQTDRLLKLNGTLISNAGKKQVWINGERQLDSSANQGAGIRLLGSARVQIRSSGSSAPHELKPGQILDPDTGSVTEAYASTAGQPHQPGSD